MSRVHPRELSLEDVVAAADVVLVVTPRDPARTVIEEPIDQPSWRGEPCAPFRTVRWHFVVEEVLGGAGADAFIAGQQLDVWSPHIDRQRRIHREYELQGKSRSYVVLTYATPPLAPDEARILFVRSAGPNAAEVVEIGAMESLARRHEVTRLLT